MSLPATRGLAAWTDAALQQAKSLIVSQREKLQADSCSKTKHRRLVQIRAELLNANDREMRQQQSGGSSLVEEEAQPTTTTTKIVHFQRHGQGWHNLLGDILRDAGVKPDVDSKDPAINPWLRPEIVDSPLTETGKEQCRGQQAVASLLRPELVIVSPLLRAIQTAEISFAHANVPWIAHEGCREELGALVCNQRRRLSEIQKDYPNLEFWNTDEHDTLWHPTERESHESKSDRIYDFLVHFLATRQESEIAVVGHSAWLFHMLNAVVDCGDDENLQSWFLTSEIRSVKLSFSEDASV